VEPRVDGGGTPATQNCSGEREPDETERERAHRRVSRVADGKAKLTVALDRARAQWWPRNWQGLSAGGGGALGSQGQSEREGTNERGEVGEQGVGRGGSDVAGERAIVGVSTTRDRGQEVRDELTGGDGGAERGRAGVGASNGADRSAPRSSERARERGRSGLRR
jgi:hypothetical protein